MRLKHPRIKNSLSRLTKYETILVLVFVLTLPLSNPWIRGDGVGYYAFGRAILIEHRLDFTKDWLNANESFRMGRMDTEGRILSNQYTVTGHLDNHFSVGPAILWSPFLLVAHMCVLAYDRVGGHIAADGYSRPYRMAMALGTAVYGFLALLISFGLARKFVAERWALLATLGIWWASSLPVYMYFNPSWSHAHSAFAVALFLWYWIGTRHSRTRTQWIILGALGGLMIDVYYINVVLLLLPLLESFSSYWTALRRTPYQPAGRLFFDNVVFSCMLFVTVLPTLVIKRIIYGNSSTFGYEGLWDWTSPAILKVCFSSDHGLFSWTPILILSVVGLFLLRKYDRNLSAYSIVVCAAFLYVIGCYHNWDGLSSFGNRFFISLTPLFVLGLATFFDVLVRGWQGRRAAILATSATAVLILWNLGLIYQWGTHLIPVRGGISWRAAAYNQVAVVPAQAARTLKNYMTGRRQLLERIELEDVNQIKSSHTSP